MDPKSAPKFRKTFPSLSFRRTLPSFLQPQVRYQSRGTVGMVFVGVILSMFVALLVYQLFKADDVADQAGVRAN